MPTVRLIALLLISLLGLVACASPGVEPRPAQPSPSAATVASSDASPTPSSSSIPAADVAKAVALRRSYGLRTDLEWIGRVMADPAADTSFGTAMTAQEVEELFARTARSEEIRGTMQAYGEAHRDEWGGLFVEQATGGTIVGLFTAHLENHRAALAATLRSPVRWDVREVRWPERDLLALQERIVADASWLESIDSPFQAAGVDTVRNVVMVAVSSARADIT